MWDLPIGEKICLCSISSHYVYVSLYCIGFSPGLCQYLSKRKCPNFLLKKESEVILVWIHYLMTRRKVYRSSLDYMMTLRTWWLMNYSTTSKPIWQIWTVNSMFGQKSIWQPCYMQLERCVWIYSVDIDICIRPTIFNNFLNSSIIIATHSFNSDWTRFQVLAVQNPLRGEARTWNPIQSSDWKNYLKCVWLFLIDRYLNIQIWKANFGTVCWRLWPRKCSLNTMAC